MLQDVPVEMSGQGSGTQSTSRQVGSALGVAILGTILFTSTAGILTSQLEELNVPADQLDQVVSAVVDTAGGAIAGLEANPQTAEIADAAKIGVLGRHTPLGLRGGRIPGRRPCRDLLAGQRPSTGRRAATQPRRIYLARIMN